MFTFDEYFNDEFVPNYSDHHGRYSYKAQPEIFLWNLDQLAIALDDANILPYNISKKYISKKRYFALFADKLPIVHVICCLAVGYPVVVQGNK